MEAPGRNIPRGYQRRASGAAVGTTSGLLECECCHRGYTSLVGIEFDYPNHPDMSVCDHCWSEYERMLAEPPPTLGIHVSETIKTVDKVSGGG